MSHDKKKVWVGWTHAEGYLKEFEGMAERITSHSYGVSEEYKKEFMKKIRITVEEI